MKRSAMNKRPKRDFSLPFHIALHGKKSSSEMNHLKEIVIGFLVTTPIHGFRHLHEGRNALEKMIWILVLITSFSLAAYMIRSGLRDAEENPILTTMDTTDIENVPFPAITVRSQVLDERILNRERTFVNPWGFIKKLFNHLKFYNLTSYESYDSFEEETKEIKARFGYVLEEALKQMSQHLMDAKENWTLKDFKDLRSNNNMINMFAEELADIAYQLAAISSKDASKFKATVQKLQSVLKTAFFQFNKYSYEFIIREQLFDKMKRQVNNGEF